MEAALEIFKSRFEEGQTVLSEELCFYSPACWPLRITLKDWRRDCSLASVARDFSLIENFLCHHLAQTAAADGGSVDLATAVEIASWEPSSLVLKALTGIEGWQADNRCARLSHRQGRVLMTHPVYFA